MNVAMLAVVVAWIIGAFMGHRAGRTEGAFDVMRSLGFGGPLCGRCGGGMGIRCVCAPSLRNKEGSE